MSLFGGDDSVPQLPTSHEDSSPSPSPEPRSPTPQSAQKPPLVSFTLDSDEDDEFADESESDVESEEESYRPNRFTSKPQTWRGYTASDRQIAASLENIDSADLAAHLYNAHNLKRRVRRPAEQLAGVKNSRSKDSWLRKGEDLQFTSPFGDVETELVPTQAWTAWPLPPKRIPARNEGLGRADSEEDTWCIGNSRAGAAGEVMREEIFALFMRLAKERWLSRDSEEEVQDTPFQHKSRPRSQSNGVQSGKSRTPVVESEHGVSDVEMQDKESVEKGSNSPSQSDSEEKFAYILGKTRTAKRRQPSAQLAFLADDDEAQRLLQPSVNSVLARLDNLALAVRRSRQNHFARGAYSDRSGSEFTSDAESIVSGLRTISRPRSRRESATKRNSQPSSRAGVVSRTKKKPKESNDRPFFDSDSASDYGADHEEDNEDECSPSESDLPKPTRSTSKKRRQDSNSSSTPRTWTQARLMDWSEVLGIAAMIGWNERAIARTAQRCAALFDEGMSFRTLDESLATEPIPEPVHYTPSTIPASVDLGIELSPKVSKRPYFEKGTLRCPHKDCYGSQQDFKFPFRVVEHVQGIHGYDPRTNDSDNEERKVGGVHIDGFLQPIGLKQGWIGGGRSKSGERKTGKRRKK